MNDPRTSFLSSVTGSNTEVLSDLINGTIIRISVCPEVCATFAGQVLAYQLATITARLFDRVELNGDDTVACHPLFSLLTGSFLPALRSLIPSLRPFTPSPTENSNVVHIIIGQGLNEAGAIYLGASGWTASYSIIEPQHVSDTLNPIGALSAGTLGASEIFKNIFNGRLHGALNAPSYTLSMLDYSSSPESEPLLPDQITIDATLFGCGSIGCGLLQGILLTFQLYGKLAIVDNGRFDTKNPYKYSLIDWATAQQAPFKSVWAQQQMLAFAKGRLKPLAFVGTAETYIASLPYDYKLPLAISAVDTIEARFEIQDTLPRRILNAGIEGTLAMVSVHNFGDGPCLACLGMQTDLESWNAKPIANATGLSPERVYELIRRNEEMTTTDIETIRTRGVSVAQTVESLDSFVGQPLLSLWNRLAYSETVVNTGGTVPVQVQVTTAFVSAFAGVLLLSELIKDSVKELEKYKVSNSYQQQLLGIPAAGTFKHQRELQGWCLCHSSYRKAIYAEKYEYSSNIKS